MRSIGFNGNRRFRALASLAILSSGVGVAHAQTTSTWNKFSGTNNWSAAANWNEAVAPTSVAGRTLIFGSPSAGGYTANNDIGAAAFQLTGLNFVNNSAGDAINLTPNAAANGLDFRTFTNVSTGLINYPTVNLSGIGAVNIANTITAPNTVPFTQYVGTGTNNLTLAGTTYTLNSTVGFLHAGNASITGTFVNFGGDRRIYSQLLAGKKLTLGAINLSDAVGTNRTLNVTANDIEFAGTIDNFSTGNSNLTIQLNPASTATYSGTNTILGNLSQSNGRMVVNTNALTATTGTVTLAEVYLEAAGAARTLDLNLTLNGTARVTGFQNLTIGAAGRTFVVAGADRSLFNMMDPSKVVSINGDLIRNDNSTTASRTLSFNGFGRVVVNAPMRDGVDIVGGSSQLAVSVDSTGGSVEFTNANTFGRLAFSSTDSLRVSNNAVLIASHADALSSDGGIELQSAIINLNTAVTSLAASRRILVNGNGGITGDTNWTIAGALQISGGDRQFFVGLNSGRKLTLNGPVNLTNDGTARSAQIGSSTGNFRFGAADIDINGVVGNGSTGVGSITYNTSGTVRISGTNTYTGATQIAGGNTVLDYTTNNGNKLGVGANGTALTLTGANLTFTGNASAFTQEVQSTALFGQNTIGGAFNGLTVNLRALTRNAGTTLDFATSATGGPVTTTTGNTNGIIPGGYTVAGTDWATAAGAGPTFTIGALGSYTASTATTVGAAAADNVDFAIDNTTAVATATRNTLRFNTSGAGTLSIASGQTLTLTNGLMVTAAMGATPVNITGGNITGPANADLIFIQNNTGAAVTVNSTVANATATNVVKAGPGRLILNPTTVNTFSGTVFVQNGILELATPLALKSFTLTATTPLAQDAQRLNPVTFNSGSAGQLLLPAGDVMIGVLTGGVARGNQQIAANTASATTLIVRQQATAGTFAGVLSDGTAGGSLSLYKNGSAELALTGNNTFTGPVTIAGGALNIVGQASTNYAGDQALGAAGKSITITNDRATSSGVAILRYSGPYWRDISRQFTLGVGSTGVNARVGFDLSNGAYANFAPTGTRGIVGGNASTLIFKNGSGVLDLANNPQAYAGRWILNDGYLMTPSFAADKLGAGDRIYLNGGTLLINGDGVNVTADRAIETLIQNVTGTVSTGNANYRNNLAANAGSTLNVGAGMISGLGGLTIGSVNTSIYPTQGTVSITGAQTFGGYQWVSVGNGTMRIDGDGALGHATNNFQFGPNNFGVLQLGGNVSSSRLFLANNQAVIDTNGFNLSLAGELRAGTQQIQKYGQGSLSIGRITGNPVGQLSATGGVLVRGGTVAATSDDAFRFTIGGTLNLEMYGTSLLLNGFDANFGNVVGNGDIDLGAGGSLTTYVTGTTATTFAGRISGTGNVARIGALNWSLTSTSTFTGTLSTDLGNGILFTGNADAPNAANGAFGRAVNVTAVNIAGGSSIQLGTATSGDNDQPRLNPTTAVPLALGSANTGGGSLVVGRRSNNNVTQTFSTVTLNPGLNAISSIGSNDGGVDDVATVTFTAPGALSRSAGSHFVVTRPDQSGTPDGTLNVTFTTAPALSGAGILGGYSVFQGTATQAADFATVSGATNVVGGAQSVPLVGSTTTGGSNVITVPTTAGLFVGQGVTSADLPAGTSITAIGAGQITVSANAIAGGTVDVTATTYTSTNDLSLWNNPAAVYNNTGGVLSGTLGAASAVQAIRFDNNAATTLDVPAGGTLTVGQAGSVGGILVTATVNNSAVTIGSAGMADLTSAGSELSLFNQGQGTASLNINTRISGNIAVSKAGVGLVSFGGTTANTYTGGTYVNQGTLTLGKPAGVVSVPGDLSILGGTVNATNAGQIATSSKVIVANNGVLNLGQTGVISSALPTVQFSTLRLGQGATINDFRTSLTLGGTGTVLHVQNNSGLPSTTNAGLSGDVLLTGASGGVVIDNYTTGTTIGSGSFDRGGVTNGTAIVTGLTTTNGLAVGMNVRYDGASTGVTIASIDSPTQITLSGSVATDTDVNIRGNTVLNLGGVQREFNVSKGNQGTDLTIASQIVNGSILKTGPGKLALGLYEGTGTAISHNFSGLTIREGAVTINGQSANAAGVAFTLDTAPGALLPATWENGTSLTLPTSTLFNIGAGGGVIAHSAIGFNLNTTFSASNQLTGSGPLTFMGTATGTQNGSSHSIFIDFGVGFTNSFSGDLTFDMSNPGGNSGFGGGGFVISRVGDGTLGSLGAGSTGQWTFKSGGIRIDTTNQTYNNNIVVAGYFGIDGENGPRQLTLNGNIVSNPASLLVIQEFNGTGFSRLTGNLSGSGSLSSVNNTLQLANTPGGGNNSGFTGTIYANNTGQIAIENGESAPGVGSKLVFGRITDTGGSLILNVGLAAQTSGFTIPSAIETYYGAHDATGARLELRVPANGRGLLNPTGASYTLSGGIRGNNGVYVTTGGPSAANTPNTGEVVLSGPTTHQGSAWINNGDVNNFIFGTGPGGIATSNAFVRFDGQISLPAPAGITNQTIYLASLFRNTTDFTSGYLFTGSAGAGTTYTLANSTGPSLAPAVKLLIGGMSNNNNTLRSGVLGASEGNATLRADVLIHRAVDTAVQNQRLVLFTRGASTVFTLGDGTQPVRFQGSTGSEAQNSLTVNGLAINSTATAVGSALTSTNTLIKRGDGTVVLGNVLYTDTTGVAVASPGTTYFWQIGRGGLDNTIATPFFEGAVRETTVAAGSGSLGGMAVTLAGGVLETNNTLQAGGFVRSLGTTSADVRWLQGGGGFAAFGGPLTVNIGGAAAGLSWASTANFVTNNNALIFGSNSANNDVTFANPINLNGGTREIRVLSNAAILTGVLSNSTGTANLTKTGPGTLTITSDFGTGSPTYSVNAGTLLASNTGLGSATGPGAVTVASGATLGGTGRVGGAVSMSAGAFLSPGASTGTLEIAANLTLVAGATTVVELEGNTPGDGPGFYDQVNVTGTADLAGNLAVSLLSGYTPTASDVFYILSRTGGTGTFAGVPEGGTVTVGSAQFNLTYLANWTGDVGTSTLTGGNDVALYNYVPEPTGLALAAMAGFGLLSRRRRIAR